MNAKGHTSLSNYVQGGVEPQYNGDACSGHITKKKKKKGFHIIIMGETLKAFSLTTFCTFVPVSA